MNFPVFLKNIILRFSIEFFEFTDEASKTDIELTEKQEEEA